MKYAIIFTGVFAGILFLFYIVGTMFYDSFDLSLWPEKSRHVLVGFGSFCATISAIGMTLWVAREDYVNRND